MSMQGQSHLQAMCALQNLGIERYVARDRPFCAYLLGHDLDYNQKGILVEDNPDSRLTMQQSRKQTVKVLFPQYGGACLEIRSQGEFERSDVIECTLLYNSERLRASDPLRTFLVESGFERTMDILLDPRKERITF